MRLPTAENLATIRVVYQTQYRGLVGIPYEMRADVGQSPRHIEEFSLNPPRSAIPRDYTEEWIALDERFDATNEERRIVREFVKQLRERDELPMHVFEFCTLGR